MAKGFPYFKFIASEWLTGDIVFEDFDLQGIFINVCALYWHRDGNISLEDLKKRIKTDRLNSLIGRFIDVDNDGNISIKFLKEQLVFSGYISDTNSKNGKLGGRPKGAKNKEKKPTANRPLTDRKAKKSKEDIEIDKDKDIELKKQSFKNLLKPFESFYETEMIQQFYDYWTEANKQKTAIRYEKETFFDVSKRLATWKKNYKPNGFADRNMTQQPQTREKRML